MAKLITTTLKNTFKPDVHIDWTLLATTNLTPDANAYPLLIGLGAAYVLTDPLGQSGRDALKDFTSTHIPFAVSPLSEIFIVKRKDTVYGASVESKMAYDVFANSFHVVSDVTWTLQISDILNPVPKTNPPAQWELGLNINVKADATVSGPIIPQLDITNIQAELSVQIKH